MLTGNLVEQFIKSRIARGLSKESVRWYEGILKNFALQNPGELPHEPEAIENYLASCRAGDERRHGYYRALRAMYRFGQRRLKIVNPFELIEPPRRKRKCPRVLMPEELDQLLSYPHNVKVKAILLFLADTGCRISEVAYLTPTDFSETPWGYVARVEGKTGVRMVPLSYQSYQAINSVVPLGWQKHWVGELVSKAFKDAQVEGTAHCLRHTFCTLWKGDIFALQRIVGHARISTTQIYRHLQTDFLSEQHTLYSPLRMVLSRSKSML